MSPRRAALYLQIPAAYCRSFGGLRWAQRGEAVEFLEGPNAGRTFAFSAEIGHFLEGLLVPGSPCPAFGSALHLLYVIGLGDRGGTSDWPVDCFPARRLERIAAPFREQGRPLRNAGALCGWLYRLRPGLPGVADPPQLLDLLELLNGGSWIPQMVLSHPMLGAMDYAEQPPVNPEALDAWMNGKLLELSDEAIRHWLRFGRGPVEGGDEISFHLPQGGEAGSLEDLEQRPRLAGMARLVERLEGALSLPPRRVEVTGLQADGYWDLTTRGAPEQILPIQFALEDEEFLRRFAERELLYFHRESPRRPEAHELVLLLDQGVRTWGDIRLVLAGAAMALARQAARRKLDVKLITTGDAGPAAPDAEAIGDLLESSDLTPNPARALAHLLEDRGSPRDVVLLTHPRSLTEPEVIEAASRPGAEDGTRLFAVSVDTGGEVELAELRRGRPVRLSRCRVELGEATSPAPPAPKLAGAAPRTAWRGDVEPIPFPFRCGLPGPVVDSGDPGCRFLDFDQSGERILVMIRYGLLSTFRLDGTDAEMLPRPIVNGEVLRPIKSVIGIAAGFVLLGGRPERPVLAHYDFPTRTCAIHALENLCPPAALVYYPDLHTIVGNAMAGGKGFVVDLAESGPSASRTWRAEQAVQRAGTGKALYPLPAAYWLLRSAQSTDPLAHLPIDLDPRTGLPIDLDPRTGTLAYRGLYGEGRSLTPMSDGSPALRGARLEAASQGGEVLAIKVSGSVEPDLWFVSMARAAVIGSLPSRLPEPDLRSLALSRDGARFARRVGNAWVEVRDVPGDRPAVQTAGQETLWIHSALLGRSCLLVREFDQLGPRRAQSHVLIRWDGERLDVEHDDPVQVFRQIGGVFAESRALSPGTSPRYDPGRFLQIVEHGDLRILLDQFNHIIVLGRDGRLIVVFYVSGREFAAWMPDGTCLGSSRLIGGEPSKAAAERIAAALRRAGRGEGGMP